MTVRMSTSYLTEAAETLDYHQPPAYDTYHKTIDMIGEEFVKKEEELRTTSLPSLSYTTTTIPTIAAAGNAGEENGVLYYNLDDLSRYIPENFSFDMSDNLDQEENGGDSSMAVEEGPATSRGGGGGSMMIAVPGDKGTQSFSIQVHL